MQALRSRSHGYAELAGIVVAGAVAPLALVAVAGGGGSLGWVALAGGAACASGLALGSTMRLLPALALALIAAAALALAAAASGETVEQRPFPAARAAEPEPTPPPSQATEARPAPLRLTPARFVRRYYAAIDAGRYKAAWARLAPAVQARFTSFDAWRSGYDTTLTQRVEHLRLEPGGLVRHDLVTVDRTPCGTTTERRFEVLWRLAPATRGFTATALYDVQLAGLDPEYAC